MNQEIVQYCEHCGKPLNSKARFCGRCGRPVTPLTPAPAPSQDSPAPPPSPRQAAAEAERIVAALPVGTQRSGFLGIRADGFVLVLTNLRILVAQQTAELMKENARQAREAAKQGGKGFFGQWGAVIGSYGSQRYLEMNPQAILNETAGNYSIDNGQVRSVKIKEHYDSEDARSEVRLTLTTVGGKIELTYNQATKKEIRQALQQTLGNLVG